MATLFVRRRWPYVAAAVAVVAALVVGVVLMLGGSDGSPKASAPPPDADPTDVKAYETILTPPVEITETTPAAIDAAAMLTASDSEIKTYVGQTLSATRVNVLRRVSANAAWVGDDAANRVLILLVGGDKPFAFAPGTKLTFTGTAAAAAPGFGQQLGLTGAELADFEAQGTYLEVSTYVEG